MTKSLWPNNLQNILDEEYLTAGSLAKLCLDGREVSSKTIKNLAQGNHKGRLETWYRLVDAINQKVNKKKVYSAEDLLGAGYRDKW